MGKLKNRRFALAVFIVLALLVSSWVVYAQKKSDLDHIDQVSTPSIVEDTKRITYVGTIESLDLSVMATDGPGVFVIRSSEGLVTVHLDSGESACDRDAIKLPTVKVGGKGLSVGDTIEVRGDKGADQIVRICETGTYVR